MIQSLSKSSIHRICSSQVITDLATAVKELVENSLDAGYFLPFLFCIQYHPSPSPNPPKQTKNKRATQLEIKLKEYGKEYFSVGDNGNGIPQNDHKHIATKHATSKLSQFEDLQSLQSFGFRGEALSSLCAMGQLVVSTKTKEDDVKLSPSFFAFPLFLARGRTRDQRVHGAPLSPRNLLFAQCKARPK